MNCRAKWFRQARACVLAFSAAMVLEACGQKSDPPQMTAQVTPQLQRPAPLRRDVSATQPAPTESAALPAQAESKLPIYEVRMKEQDLLAMDSNPYGPEVYPATFSSAGQVFENVKIRYRGAWSRSWPKKPLKIFFNDDKPFKDVHHLNLNSSFRDPSFIREPLSYYVYAACGSPSSKSELVRVNLNGQFRGVYVQVEQPDKAFLKRYNLKGALMFKGSSRMKAADERTFPSIEEYKQQYSQENQKEEDGFPLLKSFCEGLESTKDAFGFFEKNVDLEKYINYLAATTLCQNWDGYNKNHFLVYDKQGSKKWSVLPWDLDRALGDHWDWSFGRANLPIELGSSEQYKGVTGWNRMMERFFSSPELRKRLADRIQQLLETEFTIEKLGPVIDRMEAAVGPDAVLDYQRWPSEGGMYRNNRVPLKKSVQVVKKFIEDRRAFLQGELPKFRGKTS